MLIKGIDNITKAAIIEMTTFSLEKLMQFSFFPSKLKP